MSKRASRPVVLRAASAKPDEKSQGPDGPGDTEMKKILLAAVAALILVNPAMAEADSEATKNIAWILATLDPFASNCNGGQELISNIPVRVPISMNDWVNDHPNEVNDARIENNTAIQRDKSQWCATVRPFVIKLINNVQLQTFRPARYCYKSTSNGRCYY